MLAALLAISVLATSLDQPRHAANDDPGAGAIAQKLDLFEPRLLSVKFRDDLLVRLDHDGRTLTDRGTGTLAPAAATLRTLAGTWTRTHELPEDRLAQLRAKATKNLGRNTPDHNTEFYLALAEDGPTRERALAELKALDIVEHVGLVPRPADAPTAPDFTASQGYLFEAATGQGSSLLWQWPGGRGQNVRVADLEYGWNLSHVDLPLITRIGPAGEDPFNSPNHGTAVLGIMLARNDGAGTTGMCHGATGHVVPTVRDSVWNVAAAITTALTVLQPGDVILLEQQTFGPNHPGGSTQLGLVPCDWVLEWYNAVVTATGNGITVIEAAGNGSQNLDDAVYSTGNGGHWPFLPANDSGAIIVGGGLTPSYLVDDRVRLISSNYGSRVDVQSFAAFVTSLGFGQLYSVEGANVLYTNSFSGTSSASAIVAGTVAQLQSLNIAIRGVPLTPAQLRDALRTTGLPQQGSATLPASQSIGPRPNAVGAAYHVLGAIDCDNNAVPDEIDIALAPSLDADLDGAIDLCERPCGRRVSVVDNVPALVPDNTPPALTRSLAAPAAAGGELLGLVVWVELAHLFAGDVSLTLSNGATSVPLFTRPGRAGTGDGDSSDFQGRYVFADGASGDFWAAAAAAGATMAIAPGTYAPTGAWSGSGPVGTSLSGLLAENPSGPWTLTIQDAKTADRGTLIRWGLLLSVRGEECCLADFDGDGTPAVPDIFAFLGAWFANDPAADIDLNGSTDIPDIFAFLSAWFAGCS